MPQVRTEFETFVPVWKNGGFMPKERIPDFLCTITRANSADGGCGRIWKAQMIKLMQKVEICGFVNLIEGGRVKKKKNRATVEPIKRGEGLSEFAGYIWPRWLMNAWLAKSPEWKGKDGSSLGGQMKPFMSKSDIYAFLQDIAYMPATAAREVSGHTKIDEDYSNWLKDKDEGGNTLGIWSKNGKATLELRGIWQECFMKILADMSNEVSDREKGLMLFDLCLEEQKKTRSYTDSHREGLLNISFLVAWLRRNLVADTAEVSLQVFQKVLARCELTLPKIVVTSLWHSLHVSGGSLGNRRRGGARGGPEARPGGNPNGRPGPIFGRCSVVLAPNFALGLACATALAYYGRGVCDECRLKPTEPGRALALRSLHTSLAADRTRPRLPHSWSHARSSAGGSRGHKRGRAAAQIWGRDDRWPANVSMQQALLLDAAVLDDRSVVLRALRHGAICFAIEVACANV